LFISAVAAVAGGRGKLQNDFKFKVRRGVTVGVTNTRLLLDRYNRHHSIYPEGCAS